LKSFSSSERLRVSAPQALWNAVLRRYQEAANGSKWLSDNAPSPGSMFLCYPFDAADTELAPRGLDPFPGPIDRLVEGGRPASGTERPQDRIRPSSPPTPGFTRRLAVHRGQRFLSSTPQ